jgi:Xaa-Pro aminopeptidase
MKTGPLSLIYGKIRTNNLDALIITSPHNIFFLTGYPGRDSILLLSGKERTYLTDARYTSEAREHLRGYVVREVKNGLAPAIRDLTRLFKLKKIGFETRHMSYAMYEYLKKAFKNTAALTGVTGWVEELRRIKTAEELKEIKKAARIAMSALTYIRPLIKPGRKELEIAGELERFIRYNGAYAASFDIIVASGKNSSFPHHMTSRRPIRKNEPVLIDLGVEYNGFKSDLTRVFFSGKINSLCKTIYGIVREAQEQAIQRIRPGIPAGEIDTAARRCIADRGYGDNFLHSLGHGIGLEVHEAPSISEKSRDVLQPGMVFTVEPAVYLPGSFGIRLEDMVAVTRTGAEILSKDLPK